MIRALPFILYLLLAGLHIVVIENATVIYTARINLAAMMVLAVATYKPELVAVWFGFAMGLVVAASSPNLVGWHVLWLAGLGFLGYHTREKLNLDSLYAKLLLIVVGVLLHNILILLTNGATDFWYLLAVEALPGAVYTAIPAWLFFLFKEERITFAKIKALF
jgi:rod shape-determining protein MreD